MLRLLAAGLLVASGACGDDSGSGDGDAGDMIDVDAPPMMSTFYGPCTADSQCPGPDEVCLTGGFPGGLCTRRCPLEPVPDATNCLLELPGGNSRFGRCIDFGGVGTCLPICVAAIDCGGPPASCVRDDPRDEVGVCQVLCRTDGDCGGANCNPYTARCEETPTSGSEIGAACGSDDVCRSGNCSGTVLGNAAPGGYCLGTCRIPPDSEYAGSFPQAGCPGGAVCFRTGPEGGAGECLDECTPGGTDCRDGYICANVLGDGTTFSNGVCFPGS